MDMFNNNKSKSDGKGSTCRPCMKKYRKNHYEQNKTKVRASINDRKQKNKDNIWKYKCNSQCKDCGFSDPRCLEFDHLRDKEFNVSQMAQRGLSWDRILKEINKCEVVCANCHRVRTHTRGNWVRNITIEV